jgi:putative oxidoreductase
MKMLEKYADQAYALMRMVTGFMFSFHGVQILFGVLSAFPAPPAWSQTWVGGAIELVGGLAVMVGFGTRAAAFLCSGAMAVAYIQFHWRFQFDSKFLPGVNQGELAALYCVVFLLIACRGAVKWGLDKKD